LVQTEPGFPVELGGAIELHAAFRKESRTSFALGERRAQEIRESEKSLRGFLPRKTTPRELLGQQ
jgi:hypothetical protein